MTVLRVFLAGCLLAALHLTAEAAGTFIPAPSRVDVVHDAKRDALYISSGGQVLRYHLSTATFLPAFDLGGNLKSMDLSPDGDTLAVADATRAESQVWIWLVDLTTGTPQQVTFPRDFGEGGGDMVGRLRQRRRYPCVGHL